MKFSLEEAKKLLDAAKVFFDCDPEDGIKENMLNMNDVWAWACADGYVVSDEQMPELARLFWQYGNCGILYFVAVNDGWVKSEFHDNSRFIEFVKREEEIRAAVPDYNKRAYHKAEYTIKGMGLHEQKS